MLSQPSAEDRVRAGQNGPVDRAERLGIPGQKITVTARSAEATAMVATGAADLVLLRVSELAYAAGFDLAGEVPSQVQYVSVFSAAGVTWSQEAEAAKRLIAYLASDRASTAIKDAGMERVKTH